MPTINCSYKDFCELVGKKFKVDELIEVLSYAKAELDGKEGDTLTVDFNDTNQPYLWSVEGLARNIRSASGKSKGHKQLKLEKSDLIVKVDKSVAKVRPYIACFMARGPALTETQLQQLIQLQEKLAISFGRKRKKVGAGLFPAKDVAFPLTYKAVSPSSVSFVPLGMRKELNLKQVLEKHPKGKEYAWILKDAKKHPVLLTAKKEVLTFPPIINSETTGKLQAGDRDILCEVTGNDLRAVELVSSIFAYALSDRGFKIYSGKTKYASKTITSPNVKGEAYKFDSKLVESLLGIKLSDKRMKELLEKAQYIVSSKNKVVIPPYRHDVMHSVDVIEDIAIQYGYDKVEPLPLTSFTPGKALPSQSKIDTLRVLCIGFGYQEVWSAILSSKELLSDKMEVEDSSIVEIENYMSQTYSCVRSKILPILLDVLSKNRHVDYPQRLFEQGKVSILKKGVVEDHENLAMVSAHTSASFTEMKQLIEALLRNEKCEYSIEEFELDCFIPGRAAKVVVGKSQVGFLGEVHPKVLENFGLTTPVVGAELNLDRLFKLD